MLENIKQLCYKYSLSCLLLFIIIVSYVITGFLKFSIFLPIIVSLLSVIIGNYSNKTVISIFIFTTLIFIFACANYKSQTCKDGEKQKHKGNVFKASLLTVIPYFAILPLMYIVLKIYPRPEFINIFSETYGVLANKMRISDVSMSQEINEIKENNGLIIWIILTALYLTHVSEMILVLEPC
tara:strand:+ start:45 stop:590 length:546 start_codon:yes stop_codon:yes gene_type:complete